MLEKLRKWWDDREARLESNFIRETREEANHRYNIIRDDECYLTLDGERISSGYENYEEACKELFLLREMYEDSKTRFLKS